MGPNGAIYYQAYQALPGVAAPRFFKVAGLESVDEMWRVVYSISTKGPCLSLLACHHSCMSENISGRGYDPLFLRASDLLRVFEIQTVEFTLLSFIFGQIPTQKVQTDL